MLPQIKISFLKLMIACDVTDACGEMGYVH